jgi:hypothetical protein
MGILIDHAQKPVSDKSFLRETDGKNIGLSFLVTAQIAGSTTGLAVKVQSPHQGGLTRTGFPHHSQNLPFLEAERNISQGPDGAAEGTAVPFHSMYRAAISSSRQRGHPVPYRTVSLSAFRTNSFSADMRKAKSLFVKQSLRAHEKILKSALNQ